MLKVHFTAGTRAGRVIWLLEELGLDYEVNIMPFTKEGLKSAGKTFLVKEIGSEVADITENFIDDLDIDVDFSKIPEPAKEILGDTIGGIASGKNGDEALGDAFVVEGLNDGFVDSSELTVNVSLNSDTLYEYQWYLDNIDIIKKGEL